MSEQITENYVTIIPAYGRDYKAKAAVEVDFRNGCDFQMATFRYGSGYCSIRDFAPGTVVSLRYAKMMKVVNIKV